MRAVVQRVAEAQVRIGGEVVAQIGAGLAVLLGVGRGDGEADALYLAEKTLQLRVFPDPGGEMNLSVSDVGGAVLAVSQFTLYGDARRGRRPSYIEAARPEQARPLYASYVARLRASGLDVKEGVFGALMDLGLVNRGPVTILLDSRRGF